MTELFLSDPVMIQMIGFFVFMSVLTCGLALIAMVYCVYIRYTQKKMYAAMLHNDECSAREFTLIYQICQKILKKEQELTTKRES